MTSVAFSSFGPARCAPAAVLNNHASEIGAGQGIGADDGDIDVWEEVERLARSGDDSATLEVIAESDVVRPNLPLIVLVHPGDAVDKPDDVYSEPRDVREAILGYSMQCQGDMGADINRLLTRGADAVVLHRQSSHYSFVNQVNVDDGYLGAIERIHDDGAILYGDALDEAAAWVAEEMEASKRPFVLIAGAWSQAEWGCVTGVGKALEALGAKVLLSHGTSIAPGGDDKAWTPAAGMYNG